MTTAQRTEIQQYDKVYATFTPVRTDDLKKGVSDWIGRTCTWEAYWIIEDGPYKGQWAMVPCWEYPGRLPFSWVPSGDLTMVD